MFYVHKQRQTYVVHAFTTGIYLCNISVIMQHRTLITTDDFQERIHCESNGHATNDVL